jgi:hypothetical protein
MSSMKDLNAAIVEVLEMAVEDVGADGAACTPEALHAARSFVAANPDETVRVELVQAAGRGQAYSEQYALVPLRDLTEAEVRRFAVDLGTGDTEDDVLAELLRAFPLPAAPRPVAVA